MEEPLSFETYTNSEINIILRDLGESEKLNVRELLTKHNETKQEKKIKRKSKKDIIIKKNNKKKENKLEKRDRERLDYYKKLLMISH